MENPEREEIASATAVHRLGGSSIENLRLKPAEQSLLPCGISVLLGGTPYEAAKQMRQAFRDPKRYARLHRAACTVASATVEAIQAAGFEVVPDPTARFPNHARLIHPDGLAGFTDQNLAHLAKVLNTTEGC